MSFSTPFDYIKSKLDERRTEIEQHLGRGVAKDYSEYQKLCGILQGLDYAKELTQDLQKSMENDEDE
jgi:hypothetical protein